MASDPKPSEPISLHPVNPHYLLFRGKPTVLISSGEHYGAVLNPDFDYVKYLDTLQRDGLNLTRTFSGAYVEPEGAFNIARNTLAPSSKGFLCPWARSETPGYAGGGGKFDLTRWEPKYFKRLRDFVAQAAKRGIVVELTLFCPFYEEGQWRLSPFNASNNLNGLGNVGRTEVYTLDKHGGLLAVQEGMVRKIVMELKDFDNLFYEICNEPYFGGVTMEWQRHVADVIAEAERHSRHKHLITQNVANGSANIENPHPAISIFNFHYASPPDAVGMNYALNKVIGDNETGFKGTKDDHYRMEGWEFILAGGGLYNNLDYSFTVGHEDGTFAHPATQPGGGSSALRRQLKVLRDFLYSFDFVRMKPGPSVIKSGIPEQGRAYVLAEPGKQYAAYLSGGNQANPSLELPAGGYRVEWLNTLSGAVEKRQNVNHQGGIATLVSPSYQHGIALRIVRREGGVVGEGQGVLSRYRGKQLVRLTISDASSRTVPAVWVDGQDAGGGEELFALDRAGELDRLLGMTA
ncbi:MAG: hypothetical protein HY318_01515 [Armatimonadetes bacterium]|nr:hypothetical protein [Armatimonadota bacterium]